MYKNEKEYVFDAVMQMPLSARWLHNIRHWYLPFVCRLHLLCFSRLSLAFNFYLHDTFFGSTIYNSTVNRMGVFCCSQLPLKRSFDYRRWKGRITHQIVHKAPNTRTANQPKNNHFKLDFSHLLLSGDLYH